MFSTLIQNCLHRNGSIEKSSCITYETAPKSTIPMAQILKTKK